MKKILFLFALVVVSVISINDTFAQSMGSVGSKVETGQYPLEVIIVSVQGSGKPGCENTVEGCFIPKEATVAIGGKVIFSNTDTVDHTFTAGNVALGPSEEFDSGLVIAGSSYEWTPTTTGEFSYYCMVHPWMAGTIFVGEGKYIPPTDADSDDISDSVDQCPTQAETVNGFQDSDGCPDEVDNDKDGIFDNSDQCPTVPETYNDYLDSDGCPDVIPLQDSDKDGIVNSADTCPHSPETFNGYEDEDGCPDNPPVTDFDGDLIIDTLDSCPTQAETVNGFQDSDGCSDTLPITDSDNDGISDDYDKCPIQSETVNNYLDSDGCPDEVDSDKDEPILIYAAIGIGVVGTGTAIGIKLHGKGSGGKDAKKVESDKHDDNQDTSSHVEVRITGGIEE